MFSQNGFNEHTSYAVISPNTLRIQQTDTKMFTKSDVKDIISKGVIRNLVDINDKREDDLKSDLKEQKQRIDSLEMRLKDSEEKNIRYEEQIKTLTARNKELTRYCKKEKEKREIAQREKLNTEEKQAETEAMIINIIRTAKELELKNVDLQKELDEAKNSSFNDEKDEIIAKLTEDNQNLFGEFQTKTAGIRVIGQRLKDRNKQLAEIKSEHENEMDQLRQALVRESMMQTERMQCQYELKLQQLKSKYTSLQSTLTTKDQEFNRLTDTLQKLRTGSSKKQLLQYFNGTATSTSSFAQLAATPAGQKRPPFTPYSFPKRQIETSMSNFSQFSNPNRRSFSCGRSRSSIRSRHLEFDLEDNESPHHNMPNLRHKNPVLIDLTGANNKTPPNKFNISGASGNSTSKSIQTDSSKGPSEKFEEIYEVIDHVTSLPSNTKALNLIAT
ncbi:hypothetical protein M3Y97_01023100 [Aphelenchoides bicaudatus]|nr:hypothetical protein M3Y97_01023100 [Aphelenchoides bicaudatus]